MSNVKFPKKAIPPKALIQGLYQGSVPDEFKDLNTVELSMISLYSCISKIKPMVGKHYKKTGTTYTVVNDLVKVAKTLPRMLTKDEIAVVRHYTDKKVRDFQFNPGLVWKALQWLRNNNHLYNEVIDDPEWPEEWKEYTVTDVLVDIPIIELSDDEVEELDLEFESELGNNDVSVDLELPQDKEVLLYTEEDIQTHSENVMGTLASSVKPRKNVFVRTTDHDFVNPYHEPVYFWAKCFPWLYPYGFGCPSDPNSKLPNLRAHSKQMLMRGGGPNGRRFQQDPSWYFAVYHYESRRKIGGIASRAHNPLFDHIANPEAVISSTLLSQMISFANEAATNESSTHETSDSSAIESSESSTNESSTTNVLTSTTDTNLVLATTPNDPLSEPLPKMTREEFEFYTLQYKKNVTCM